MVEVDAATGGAYEKIGAFIVALGREDSSGLRRALFEKLELNDYEGFYALVSVGEDSFKTLRQICGFEVEQTAVTLEVSPNPEGPRFLNFVVKEYIGAEVYLKDEERGLVVAKNYEDLQEGTEIFVPALFGGYYKLLILDIDDTKKVAGAASTKEETGTAATLEYDKDDRHCWVANGIFNMDAMKRLDFR